MIILIADEILHIMILQFLNSANCQRGVKFMFYGHQTGLFGACCTGTVALCVGYTPGCRNCEEWLI